MEATAERQRMTGQSLDYREMGREEDREEGGGNGGREKCRDRKSLEFIRG